MTSQLTHEPTMPLAFGVAHVGALAVRLDQLDDHADDGDAEQHEQREHGHGYVSKMGRAHRPHCIASATSTVPKSRTGSGRGVAHEHDVGGGVDETSSIRGMCR
jgi:hypothetical protein